MKTFALKCPGCGAAIGVTQNDDVFACTYCGASVRVERGEGKVSLRLFAEAIQRVTQGVDRTAAELAIARISKEISQLRREQAKNQVFIDSLEAESQPLPEDDSPSSARVLFKQILVGLAKGAFLSGFLVGFAVFAFRLSASSMLFTTWLILALVLAIGHVQDPLRKIDRGVAKLYADAAKFKRRSAPLRAEQIALYNKSNDEIETKLRSLTQKLEAARAIVF